MSPRPRDCPTQLRSSPCRNILQNRSSVFCQSRSMPYSIKRGRNLSQATAEMLMMSLAARRAQIVAALTLLIAFTLLAFTWPSVAQERRREVYTPSALGTVHAVVAEHGMVGAQEKIAARIGADILRQVSNAIDAEGVSSRSRRAANTRAGPECP